MEQCFPDDGYPPNATLDADVVDSVLASVDSGSYAIAVMPSTGTLTQIISTLSNNGQQLSVSILGTESYFSAKFSEQAYLTCLTAELSDQDMIDCYQTQAVFSGRHLYSDTELATVVAPGSTVHVTENTQSPPEPLSSARDHISDGNTWSPDIPRLGRMKKTIASHLGDDAADELVPLLKRVPVSGSKTDIELLNTLLLLAARHQCLFQDVAQWGVETGTVTRSSLTRRRDTLTEAGLIRTKKTRVGIGRPRIQLSPRYPLTTDSHIVDYLTTAQDELNEATV